jgi:hypothetical protein
VKSDAENDGPVPATIVSPTQSRQIAELLGLAFLEIQNRISAKEYKAAIALAYACHNLPAFQAGSDHNDWIYFQNQFIRYHESHGKFLFDFLAWLEAIEAGRPVTPEVWIVHQPLDPAIVVLIEVLRDTRLMLCRSENDFTWSSWEDAPAAVAEIDGLLSRLNSGEPPERSQIEILFLPTGPLQEISLSNGWGPEFLKLANRCDTAMEQAYGNSAPEGDSP